MYQVLIVDDELPAQRFVRNIIEQFAKDYQVVGTASGGEQAMEILAKHPIDLLITDISMHGMTGIELAQEARKLQSDIHIVIISGYGEFEYAQGAIQANVDDYLLKPVSIRKMTTMLQTIAKKLDSESALRTATLLPAIACSQYYDEEAARQLYGRRSFRFALVRWGNLDMTLPKSLTATALMPSQDAYFQALRGRDDEERILIAADAASEDLLIHLSVYLTRPGTMSTWTAIYTPSAQPIDMLPSFIKWAITLLHRQVVIGKHQILQYTGGTSSEDVMRLPTADMKQLSYFISTGKNRMIKEYFVTLAVNWERSQTPQRQVWHMGRQMIHQIATSYQPVYNRLEELLQDFNDLIRCANSYGDLMYGLYAALFENDNVKDRRMSTRELYDYAVQYIDANYALPLSMQSVCDEIGISQTYLSRLFRKYSDTTFNAYLTRCRMEAAMRLLREKPDYLLRDVATCVGYDDSSYFTKVFHQYTGQTPSQFIESGNS